MRAVSIGGGGVRTKIEEGNGATSAQDATFTLRPSLFTLRRYQRDMLRFLARKNETTVAEVLTLGFGRRSLDVVKRVLAIDVAPHPFRSLRTGSLSQKVDRSLTGLTGAVATMPQQTGGEPCASSTG